MSFDEEDSKYTSDKNDDDIAKTFFGFEVGDSVTYGVVIVLTIIFIYQVSGATAVL
jgi:hypothetical protein